MLMVLKNKNMFYLYLIECNDNTYYIGVTNDLSRRLIEHQDGLSLNSYTHNRRPIKLKYYLEFDKMSEAIFYEKRLKKWSKAKKEAFFKREWDLLRELSKCKKNNSNA